LQLLIKKKKKKNLCSLLFLLCCIWFADNCTNCYVVLNELLICLPRPKTNIYIYKEAKKGGVNFQWTVRNWRRKVAADEWKYSCFLSWLLWSASLADLATRATLACKWSNANDVGLLSKSFTACSFAIWCWISAVQIIDDYQD
jgi:hypothetical protein